MAESLNGKTPVMSEDGITPARRFSKKRKREKIVIVEEDDTEKEAWCVEMNGTLRDQWMATMAARMRLDASGKPVGVKNFDGLQASLLTKCIVNLDNSPIGVEEIQKWPASTQKELFDLCQEMNGLTEASAEEAKKN